MIKKSVFTCVLLCATSVFSVYGIPISGSGTLGSLTGNVSYSASGSTAANLILELTNTSPAGNGGYLTAVVLNEPAAADSVISSISLLTSTLGSFGFISDNGKGNSPTKVEPYGVFDFGASSTGQFLGGGSPTTGLAVGHSMTLTFALAGAGLNSLTVDSFLNAPEGGQSLIARFRGFNDGGSNKTPASRTAAAVVIPDSATGLLPCFAAFCLIAGYVRTRWRFPA